MARAWWIAAGCTLLAPVTTAAATATAWDGSRWHADHPEFVGALCAAIESKVIENRPGHASVNYVYQQMLADAAGVEAADSADVFGAKVRAWINPRMGALTCNTVNFTPRNGNILKLAVARQNSSFIRDVTAVWRIDLNTVDATDGKTVLDYIAERSAAVGTASSFGKTLARTLQRFREAGAKHASELR